jgi:hypothetical protein
MLSTFSPPIHFAGCAREAASLYALAIWRWFSQKGDCLPSDAVEHANVQTMS